MKSCVIVVTLCAATALAQETGRVERMDSMPIYRVTVVARTAKAINYRHRSGATKIDFRGTAMMPEARGEARVESKQGRIEIDSKYSNLGAPSRFGPEYLTYVLWAITPEGRPANLGEVLVEGSNSKLFVTTDLQAFGLIVTAEPYFAVTQPSDVVVMENLVRAETLGKFEEIEAKYELLQRGQYTMNVAPQVLRTKAVVIDKNRPLEVFEARNAVQIAQWAGADKYASDTFKKANDLLSQAQEYQSRKHPERKPAAMIAREAVQTAEDARLIALKRQDDERIAREKQEAADREARAKAEAEAEAQKRQAAEQAQSEAERVRREAEMAAEKANRERAEAESARAAALADVERIRQQATQERAQLEAARAAAQAQQQEAQADAEKARHAADEANRMRQQAENDKQQLRQQLLQQLNLVLETRNTARGLIVNMSDVLFDTAKYTLRPGAREKLAKVAGIVLAHSGLKLQIEGYTDSVGGDDYNQTLSERRAASVRDYLMEQGMDLNSVTARGFGKTRPVASNDTAAGRQQNRRVEIVVSGDIIGSPVTSVVAAPAQ